MDEQSRPTGLCSMRRHRFPRCDRSPVIPLTVRHSADRPGNPASGHRPFVGSHPPSHFPCRHPHSHTGRPVRLDIEQVQASLVVPHLSTRLPPSLFFLRMFGPPLPLHLASHRPCQPSSTRRQLNFNEQLTYILKTLGTSRGCSSNISSVSVAFLEQDCMHATGREGRR